MATVLFLKLVLRGGEIKQKLIFLLWSLGKKTYKIEGWGEVEGGGANVKCAQFCLPLFVLSCFLFFGFYDILRDICYMFAEGEHEYF